MSQTDNSDRYIPINDKTLKEIGSKCPNLEVLRIDRDSSYGANQQGYKITRIGIKAIVEKCRKLRVLTLQQIRLHVSVLGLIQKHLALTLMTCLITPDRFHDDNTAHDEDSDGLYCMESLDIFDYIVEFLLNMPVLGRTGAVTLHAINYLRHYKEPCDKEGALQLAKKAVDLGAAGPLMVEAYHQLTYVVALGNIKIANTMIENGNYEEAVEHARRALNTRAHDKAEQLLAFLEHVPGTEL